VKLRMAVNKSEDSAEICLIQGLKFRRCYMGVSHPGVRILIIKLITEAVTKALFALLALLKRQAGK
jgi:hypothetical protein